MAKYFFKFFFKSLIYNSDFLSIDVPIEPLEGVLAVEILLF